MMSELEQHKYTDTSKSWNSSNTSTSGANKATMFHHRRSSPPPKHSESGCWWTMVLLRELERQAAGRCQICICHGHHVKPGQTQVTVPHPFRPRLVGRPGSCQITRFPLRSLAFHSQNAEAAAALEKTGSQAGSMPVANATREGKQLFTWPASSWVVAVARTIRSSCVATR